MDLSKASSAITAVYDAAIDPQHWSPALTATSQFVESNGAMLFSVEPDPGAAGSWNLQEAGGLWLKADPAKIRYATEEFWQYEREGMEFHSELPPHTLIPDNEYWTQPDLDERPDYSYLAEHFGIRRKLAGRLNGGRRWFDCLMVQFDQKYQNIPPAYIEHMRALLPHYAKAVELSRTFRMLKSQYQAALSALDYVDIGLCITLDNGEVIVANEEARRLLEEKDGLFTNAAQKLRCRDDDTNRQLQAAIIAAGHSARGEGQTTEVLLSSPRRSDQPVLLEVAPLRDTEAELDSQLQGALVTIIDPKNPQPFRIAPVAKVYGLTTSEAEVCSLLMSGLTNREIADQRDVSPETVKAQVAAVLAKTECNRRSDLIRRVLKTSPPVKAVEEKAMQEKAIQKTVRGAS